MQKYMVETEDGSRVFFVDYSFKSALDQARAYIGNMGKIGKSCQLYFRNLTIVGPTWIKCNIGE